MENLSFSIAFGKTIHTPIDGSPFAPTITAAADGVKAFEPGHRSSSARQGARLGFRFS
jgi:hypothetical protein